MRFSQECARKTARLARAFVLDMHACSMLNFVVLFSVVVDISIGLLLGVNVFCHSMSEFSTLDSARSPLAASNPLAKMTKHDLDQAVTHKRNPFLISLTCTRKLAPRQRHISHYNQKRSSQPAKVSEHNYV